MKTILVTTKAGQIAGTEEGGVCRFTAVPFAAPPVGEYRFRAPQPLTPWDGVYPADHRPNRCPQMQCGGFYGKEFQYDDSPAMDEDCLYLNVFAPENASGCPVAVWFHGGAFCGGNCAEITFDGTEYARRGVILVSANYRLGIFGWFAHPGLDARDGTSGNYGLLDQMAVLRWVKENIAAFGGDADNVTIFGQSAGGMCVQMLSSSPMAKGLFRRAIIQSSGGFGGSPLPSPKKSSFEARMEAFLCEKQLTLDTLCRMPWQQLQALVPEYNEFARRSGFSGYLGPVVDGAVLPCTDTEAAAHGLTHAEAYMTGCTSNDMCADAPNIEDSTIYRGMADWCAVHEKRGIPCYAYLFDRPLPGDDAGAFHSSELWFTFGTYARCWRPLTSADAELSMRMLDAWCSFIRSGDPGQPRCTGRDGFVKVWRINE